MAKNLVIVESPAKAKSINKILGKDFIVKASIGHVRDLPTKELGVDIEKGFEPKYVMSKGKSKVIKELKDEAKKSENVYLASDPDREGEAIAWHLFMALRKGMTDDQFHRVTYNEITASAIKEAFSEPGPIDIDRVNSQQARRILDRIVGYKVSPLLWRAIRGSKSAGRVQSVALRLVCEREELINNFNPEEFWVLGAQVQKQEEPKDAFEIRLARVNDDKPSIGSEEAAKALLSNLEGQPIHVSGVTRRELKKKAQPPFITSTLQQAGSRFFGFTPSRTMKVAQALYEGVDFGEGPVGVITYMRTDSTNISKQAQSDCRAYVKETYGEEYVPAKPNAYKSRGSAQEAHEAIRPTDVKHTPASLKAYLKPEELKLYTAIWNRFVASQMAPAQIAQRTVEFAADGKDGDHRYLFRASTSDVVFPGYMKVTASDDRKQAAEEKKEENQADEEKEQKLPELKEGESVNLLDWLSEQKFTQPPGRYTEASLVRALEENGVGRPSTYAQILYVLQDRKYVEKEKRSLKPTNVGDKVNKYLVEHLPELFDIGFTAGMEERLDRIEQGDVDWTKMLADFYKDFESWIEKAKGPDATTEQVEALLSLADQVKEWNPPVKRGKRTYSDEKYVETLRKQLADGKKPVSNRQYKALEQLVCRYREQVPDVEAKAAEFGLEEALAEAKKPKEPPRECSQKKLELLSKISFDEPRKVGKRTYDDKEFAASLGQQVEQGKRLSENQVRYLDRLVIKYSDQIENYETLKEELNLDAGAGGVSAEIIDPILKLFESVKEWKPPVQRGKRTWDDKEFFSSLEDQFKKKKTLSERQVASLKKMAVRYADQIPGYEAAAEELGLAMPKPKKEKAS